MWSGSGWGNGVELTGLTSPESPHLFLELQALGHGEKKFLHFSRLRPAVLASGLRPFLDER